MTTSTHELRVQAGTQADFTTPATPTVILRGIEEMGLRSANNIELLADMSLGLAGSSTAVVRGVGASGGVKGWASYEQLAYWLDNLFGESTPSGAGPYTRAGGAPTTTAPSPRILSLVKGDGTIGAYQMVGGLLTRFKLRLEPEDALRFDGDLIGNVMQADTLASLSVPTVTPIMASHVDTLYWDAWGGTMGSTALAQCTLRFLELEAVPDRKARACIGSLTKDAYVPGVWEGTLKVGLEFNATTKAEVDAIIGGTLTQKQFEVNFASGTDALTLQFAGTVNEDLEIFSDDDGVVTVDLSLTRTYHTTFANWFKYSLVNSISALV